MPQYNDAYMYEATPKQLRFEAQFMKKSSNTKGWVDKNLDYKKGVYSNYIHRYSAYYTVWLTLCN